MEELKQRIILETTKMFADYGIKAIRMDDIASRMGISKRTLYEIFGDKEALIIDCILYLKEEAEAKSREIMARAGNIIEEFILMIEYWESNVGGNHNIMMDIKRFYPKIYDKVMDRHVNHSFDKLKNELQRGVDDGYLLERVDLDLALSVFGYSMYGIAKHDAMLPRNVSDKEAFKYVTTYFLRGIATRKGIDIIDNYFKNKTGK